jgi:hypothetical protein
MHNLPTQHRINIDALHNLFTNKHTSYKYLFFQAILAILQENNFSKNNILFETLENKMLEIAKYPILIYKLNFGKDDRIATKLHNKYEKIDLLKYVVYRIIVPFLDKVDTKGLVSPAGNARISELSAQDKEYRAIYKINECKNKHNNSITIYPEWLEYLNKNFILIQSWSFWHWANYLQSKNPNTLSLINKLQKPSGRMSLQKQTKYWKTILNKQPFNCIFSGDKITPNNFSLDHFLPWSFIGHNQLWNLIPTPKNDNSIKNNNIPSMQKYLDKFIEVQKIGLEIAYNEMGKDKWENSINDFATDFNMEFSDLHQPNETTFTNKYKDIIMPLSTIAKNGGFRCDWVY